MRPEMVEAFIGYIARGWALVALVSGSKYVRADPAIPFHDSYIARWRPDILRKRLAEMEEVNIGVWTLSPEPLVIDLDSEGARSRLEPLLDGLVPPTVRTHRGWHWYFAWPVNEEGIGYLLANRKHNDQTRRIDLRGWNGYALLPPSIHPDGTVYTWEVPPGDRLPDMPPRLAEWVLKHFLHEAKDVQDTYPEDHYPDGLYDDDEEWVDEVEYEFDDLDDEDDWDDDALYEGEDFDDEGDLEEEQFDDGPDDEVGSWEGLA